MAQPIDFVADILQFRSVDGNTRWEFQYAYPDTAVTYALTPEGYLGELFCSLQLTSAEGDTVIDEWIAVARSKERTPKHRRFHTGIRKLFLSPGVYTASLTVRDLNDTTRVLTSEFKSNVRRFGLQPSVSDIMFVTPVEGALDSMFLRNGVDALPNPRHEIVGQDPSIAVYSEVYNAKTNRLDTFVVEYMVLDNVLREMMTTYGKMVAVDDGLVIRENIPAGALRSGVYTLKISIRKQDLSETYSSIEERFYILNPELPPSGAPLLTEEEKFLASEWSVKTGDDLEHELELSDVLASSAERQIRKEMQTERAKQRYLYRFWQSRDTKPNTVINERLQLFREMYDRANKLYSNAMIKEGWKTDRGITLLKYGRATQVERFIQTIDTKPYEIWFYQNIQGGAKFYFVDWQLMQNHKLVHSTAIGEIRDEKWFDRYARAFTPDINREQDYLPTAR